MADTVGPEPVVITSSIYDKAKKVFGEHGADIQWQVCPDAEAAVAERIVSHKARIAALGTTVYRGELYKALQANARGAGALIARFGVGYDGIDLKQCRDRDIRLTITPGTLNQSVAEHAIALMLALVRHIPSLERRFREGVFQHKTGIELSGKTLGLAGFGGIGKKVAQIASAGFGMNVIAYDVVPMDGQCRKEGLSERDFLSRHGLQSYVTDFSAIASKVDIMSVHMPAMNETRGFFNAERLRLLRQGAWLINTSRGALVEERALFDALKAGALGGAGLDVFSSEPYAPADVDHDLRTLDNVVLTPHVASDTVEANESMARRVIRNILAFREGRREDLDLVP